MRFLTAKRIHDGRRWLPEGSVVEVSGDGAIVSIQQGHASAVFYEGVLAPGFVNTHCHLELSHMKGIAPEHTGLIPFLKKIPLRRNSFTEVQKRTARYAGHDELVRNGVVAVGDISNTTDTMDVRALGELHFCTFIESIGFTEANAEKAFQSALKTYSEFSGQLSGDKNLKQAVTPHAPYSVSAALFRLIDAHKNDALISIHNQESEEENSFYTGKEGLIRDLLKTLGIDDGPFEPTGRSSLQSYLEWMSAGHPFIFVHNTYTTREDVRFALDRLKQAYWCVCPNANLYLEHTLPDIDMLVSERVNICVGTDSLASNHELSILSELHSIKKHYPAISWEALLTWGTLNGARALQMDDTIGTIEPGKKPGIIQIVGIDDGARMPQVIRIV